MSIYFLEREDCFIIKKLYNIIAFEKLFVCLKTHYLFFYIPPHTHDFIEEFLPRIRQKATPVINERLNDAIKKEQLLVIDPTGHKHGPMLKADALALAKDHGLDLYLVSEPKEGVAVAKILNYGRVHYNKIKKAKALKKQQAVIHNREIRFRVRIAEHDQKVKIKKIQEFLEAQQRVKISLRFRGREAAHPELGFAKINEIIEAVAT